MRLWTGAFISLFLVACAHNKAEKAESTTERAEIQTQEVTYKVGDLEMVGYLAKPKALGDKKVPGVLVVHEWWGQTDYPRRRAEMLAELGYVALAVDMYGERKLTEHPKDAGAFAKAVMSDAKKLDARFQAALETLKKDDNVNADDLAAIGYCFGGSVVLEMARQGVNLDGVVSFHGGLMTPSRAKKGETHPQILVLNGAADKMVNEDHIKAFKEEMDQANVKYEFVSYEGAMHGFTNPAASQKGKKLNMPLAYNKEADEKSWAKMKAFLDNIF